MAVSQPPGESHPPPTHFGVSPHVSTAQDAQRAEPYVYTSIRYHPSLRRASENTAVSFNVPCPFYMLEHHWTRLQVANWSAQFWPKERASKQHERPAHFLRGLLYAVKQWLTAHPEEVECAVPLRIRLRMYPSGRATTEIRHASKRAHHDLFPKSFDTPQDVRIPEWTVTLDHTPTEASEATMFKIWDRSPQSRARADAGIFSLFDRKEVLLFTQELEVIDGSNSTPYFRRNGGWVTPISTSGGLQGTTRRWALEQGLCTECAVRADTLGDGETIWFSNAVNGFFRAIYHPRDPTLPLSSPAQIEGILQQLC